MKKRNQRKLEPEPNFCNYWGTVGDEYVVKAYSKSFETWNEMHQDQTTSQLSVGP